jgi:hypothetical protein
MVENRSVFGLVAERAALQWATYCSVAVRNPADTG